MPFKSKAQIAAEQGTDPAVNASADNVKKEKKKPDFTLFATRSVTISS